MESSYTQFVDSESCQIMAGKKNTKTEKGTWAQGLWTMEEKLRYVAFILYNKDTLSSKLQRRASKIFKQMSNFVGVRSPSQCRSQNQKMYKRFKTVNRIVVEFKKEMVEGNFEEAYRDLQKEPSIKFQTESELKMVPIKIETAEEIKKVEQVGIQTEEGPTMLMVPQNEAWLYNMFKCQMMSNYCANPYVQAYPQSPL